MGFSIDTLVVLNKWILLNPVLSLVYVATYFAEEKVLNRIPLGRNLPENLLHRSELCAASILILFCWILTWTSHLWSNRTYLSPISAKQWKDELVVITGGASGIGYCTAQRLAARGAKVVTIDIQNHQNGSTASARGKNGQADPNFASAASNIQPYICDISSADALQKVAKSIRAIYGNPTVLINNAGFTHSQPITSLSADQVSRLISVNLTAQLWTIQEFLPGMIERAKLQNKPSHIICTASVMGHVGTSQMVDYCASKHGVVGLHKALRYELDYCHRCPQIRTTLLVLGHVKTSLFDGLRLNALARFLGPSVEPDQVAAKIESAIQRRRGGTIALPWYANWTEALSLLPSWANDLLHWTLGSHTSMDRMNQSRRKTT